ncbi:MAG TPA: hypothetical protein VK978_05190 [Candidatus Saccharimonadales bacterium]|nr:hypothetical protein [Candidatus Saccharimonadales bacterium]
MNKTLRSWLMIAATVVVILSVIGLIVNYSWARWIFGGLIVWILVALALTLAVGYGIIRADKRKRSDGPRQDGKPPHGPYDW